jgi:hypothetical protein
VVLRWCSLPSAHKCRPGPARLCAKDALFIPQIHHLARAHARTHARAPPPPTHTHGWLGLALAPAGRRGRRRVSRVGGAQGHHPAAKAISKSDAVPSTKGRYCPRRDHLGAPPQGEAARRKGAGPPAVGRQHRLRESAGCFRERFSPTAGPTTGDFEPPPPHATYQPPNPTPSTETGAKPQGA